MLRVGIFAAIVACFLACAVSRAEDVVLKQSQSNIEVTVGGKPFTTYHFDATDDPKFARPFFFPVLTADGTALTSDQVLAKEKDPKADHPHHRSLYVAHGDVNGADHWSLTKGDKQPRQRHLAFDKVAGNTIVQRLAWESADRSSVILDETRTMKFLAFPDGSRGVDFTLAFKPAGKDPVTFGDTKEAGLCSVRVAKAISDKPTITNADGKTGEKDTWGKPSTWCDISGQIDGKPYGVAVLDHPGNPRHPTRWHVRAYGLLSANPFGVHDFDKVSGTPGAMTLEPGTTTTFRYRVVFHAGDVKAAGLPEKLAAFAKE